MKIKIEKKKLIEVHKSKKKNFNKRAKEKKLKWKE